MFNYKLIRFKRFVSLFTIKLCNELFFQLYLMLYAFVPRFDVMDTGIFLKKTKHGLTAPWFLIGTLGRTVPHASKEQHWGAALCILIRKLLVVACLHRLLQRCHMQARNNFGELLLCLLLRKLLVACLHRMLQRCHMQSNY